MKTRRLLAAPWVISSLLGIAATALAGGPNRATFDVSAFCNLYQRTDPNAVTALSTDPTPAPLGGILHLQEVHLQATGCAVYCIECGAVCSGPNGESSEFRGLPVYSLIGQWSTDPGVLDPNTVASDPFFVGENSVLAAPSGGGLYYLFLGYNDGIFDDNASSFTVAATWTQLSEVQPHEGVESGGETVNLIGSGFIPGPDLTVTIGGAPATVLSMASDRIRVAVPPGQSFADVTVTDSLGATSLPGAYRYVPSEVAARFGNVGLGAEGDRENVLFVNDLFGDAGRFLFFTTDTPLRIEMRAPASRSTAPYAVYVWPGEPRASTLTAQPYALGTMCFPTPLNGGAQPQPIKIGNNLHRAFGTANLRTAPAPSVLGNLPNGWRRPILVTIQGFIRDDASLSPTRVSITNAICLRIV
ncbi:MAG: IPT/TIG domain-containing protein [Planctomycetes bacterium]|nr:IPT/TIG domain-containing protein [Planctomycetota bacterium]MBI3843550.1 IPT/TIG domain-containing protein [Planctomycetota bacterium]